MELTKEIKKIIAKPSEGFKGTKHEWKKLIRSIIIPPDPHTIWEMNKNTGEWTRTNLR